MNRFLKAAAAGALALGLGACSTVQSWFPDKQKEYRYSTEIPALEIPPNLVGTMEGSPTLADEPAEPVVAAGSKPAPAAGATPAPEGAIADSPIGKYRPSPVGAEGTAVLAKDSTSAHIVVEAPFPNVWTMVEKAVNRMRIEIKDKDRSQKVFYVYYSENAKPFEPSWTDDILSPFGGGSKHRDDEREYQVRLEDLGDVLTKVRVFDDAGQAQSEGEGYKLLQSIQQKILVLSQPESERKSGDTRPENEQPGDEEEDSP